MHQVSHIAANPQSDDKGPEKAQNIRIAQISDGGAAAGTEGSVLTLEPHVDYNPGSPVKMVTTAGEGKRLPGKLTSH